MTNGSHFAFKAETLMDTSQREVLENYAQQQSENYAQFMNEYIRGEYSYIDAPEKPDTFAEGFLLAPRPPTNWERQRKRHTYYTRLQNGGWKSPAMKASLEQVIYLAKTFFRVPMVASSIITSDKWINQCSTDNLHDFHKVNRELTLCGHAILRQDRRPLVVLDAAADWRFQKYPQVASGMVRFYAGIPLLSNAQNLIATEDDHLPIESSVNFAIGTLCIVDSQPRESFTLEEEKTLQYLGSLMMTIVDAYLCDAHVVEQQRRLQRLAEFVRIPSHTNAVTVSSRFADMQEMVKAACKEITSCFNDTVECEFFISKEECEVQRTRYRKLEKDCISAIVYETPSSLASNIHGYYLVTGKTDEEILTQDDQNTLDLFANASTTFLQDISVYRANLSKTIFLDSMSHELRTPAHGMTATIELVLENKDLPPDVASLLKMAQISGKGLHNVLSHLLDFKKMETEEMDKGTPEVVNLDATLQDLLDGYATLLKPRVELRFVNDLPFHLSHCHVNVDMFRAACNELISNAIKFTDAGTVLVSLKAPTQEDEVILIELTVEDTGRGMNSMFVKNDLFTAFCKEDSFSQGAGLGLVLAQKYASNLSQGRLEVVSSSPAKGSMFSLRFSVEAPPYNIDTDGIYIEEYEKWERLRNEIRPSIVINDDRHEQEFGGEIRNRYHAFYEICNPPTMQNSFFPSATSKPFFVHIIDTRCDAIAATNVLSPNNAEREIQRLGSRYQEKGGGCVIVVVDCAALLTFAIVAEQHNEVVTITCAPFGRSKACTLINGALSIEYNARKARRVKDIQRLQLQRELQASPDHIGVLAAKNIFALVVDDNAVNVNILSAFLRKRSIAHITAVDGLLAVKQFVEQSGKINLVLMDYSMPRCNGIEAVQEIRRIEQGDPEKYGVSKIAMLTGIADNGTREKALTIGCCDSFWAKPLRLKDIDNIIKTWFDA